MSKKTLIIIIGVVVAIIVATITTVVIVNNNKKASKTTVAENNIDENNVVIPTDEPSEEPTDEPTTEPSDEPNKQDDLPKVTTQTKYYIKVNTTANTVTVYSKGNSGEYEPTKAMICSTGTVTPRNSTYTIRKKFVDGNTGWRTLFGHGPYKNVYGQYSQWITGDILFHSVPYIKKYDKSSLEWYEYNKLGTTCSQGCIRLKCSDAKWLYDNCPVGTPVEFYDSADPGPLGKPSFQYISENSPNKGWDPTDPDPANPWRNSVSTPVVTPENPTPEVPATNAPTTNTPSTSKDPTPEVPETDTPVTPEIPTPEIPKTPETHTPSTPEVPETGTPSTSEIPTPEETTNPDE